MALTTATEPLTVAEFAERWRVHPVSVYRWIAAGQLEHVRLGGVIRIPADAHLAARRDTPVERGAGTASAGAAAHGDTHDAHDAQED
jgi:excisionase family DNA binding protein